MAEHIVDLDDWEEYDPSKGSFVHHMIAGSAAGVAEHICMFPVDTYKTHQQFEGTRASGVGSFFDLARREGFTRLWRGSPAVLVGCIPSHAAYFSSYEVCKEKFGANGEGHHPVAAAASGAVATTLHDAVLTPLDVVKQRLQLGYYGGIRDCVRTMLREEGPRAFFRSYPTTLFMNMPYAATVVASNESLKKVLTRDGEAPGLATFFVAGGGAAALAAAATCPLDAVKTRLQTSSLLERPPPPPPPSQPKGAGASAAAAAAANAAASAPVAPATAATVTSSSASSSSTTASSSRAASVVAPTLPASTAAPSSVASSSSLPSSSASSASSALRSTAPSSSLMRRLWESTPLAKMSAAAYHPLRQTTQVALLYTSSQAAATATPAAPIGGAAATPKRPFTTGPQASAIGAVEMARRMWTTEGSGAFFRGVRARMAVHAPSGAISWATYETVKAMLVANAAAGGQLR